MAPPPAWLARCGTLVALSLGALVVPVHAQEPSEAPGGSDHPGPDRQDRSDRGRAHVLHLANGGFLRGRARETAVSGSPGSPETGREARWEIWKEGRWVALPPGTVLRGVPEHELLAQAKRLEREAGRDDPVRRSAFAAWLVQSGLLTEALATLDKILAQDPDQPDALALLARARIPLALPEPVLPPAESAEVPEAFLAAAARGRPAAQAIAVERLRSADAAGSGEAWRELLRRETVHPSPRRRAFALLATRRLELAGAETRTLIERAILDPSEAVRAEAGRALRDAGGESPGAASAVVQPVLGALSSSHPLVRVHAADALGVLGAPAAVEPLLGHLAALQTSGGGRPPRAHIFSGRQIAYVGDFDVEVAQNESIADPTINVLLEGAVLEAALVGVTERRAVTRALTRITGIDAGRQASDWQRWWKDHGEEWQASRNRPPEPPSPRSPGH